MADNELFPLFSEDEDDIRERIDADANFQTEPSSTDFIDVRVGGFYYDVTQPLVIEYGRFWDALNETVAASNILTAWGVYLSNWALVLGLEREDAVQAIGRVLLRGEPGTIVGSGLIVAAQQTSPDVDPPEYESTEGGTISEEVLAPAVPTLTATTTEGTLATGTYFYKITAINAIGESLPSPEASKAVTGPTGKVKLEWAAVPGATGYKIYRSKTTNTEVYLTSVGTNTFTDTGSLAPGVNTPPIANTTAGGLIVFVRAIEPGTSGNVGVGGISEIVSGVPGLETVTNSAPITGGQDIEDDEELRARVLLRMRGGGAGNIADYESWALEYPGVGRVTVFPVFEAIPGQVGLSITDVDGDPVDESIVEGLQDELCPLPGQGGGKAPIGDTVVVFTPSVKLIEVSGIYSFESGFSLDGTGGTVPLRNSIVLALESYVNNLLSGDDVVYHHVLAQNFKVRGVKDVTSFKVNGAETTVAVANSEVAQLKLPPTLS